MGSPAGPVNGRPTPPPGYKLDVKPPTGYELDDFPNPNTAPAFLQQGLDLSKVKQVMTSPRPGLDGPQDVAYVSGADPYKINVLQPDIYGPPVMNHELTHTYQDTRNENLPQVSAPISPNTGDPAADWKKYHYGGIQGLQQARAQKKTVSDFNAEQQAEIVKDYKSVHDEFLQKAAAGKITPRDEREMYDMQQAYHPYIKQLAEMPGENENLDRNSLLELLGFQKPATINTKPEPPGLPAYDTPGLGVLPADPLMGGKSQATTPHSRTMVVSNPRGLVEPGNLPIEKRPVVKNSDGKHSTEYSVSFRDDKGAEVLVPTVVNGKFLTTDGKKPPAGSQEEKDMFKKAWDHYKKTGEHLGKFDSPENADAYANILHNRK